MVSKALPARTVKFMNTLFIHEDTPDIPEGIVETVGVVVDKIGTCRWTTRGSVDGTSPVTTYESGQ